MTSTSNLVHIIWRSLYSPDKLNSLILLNTTNDSFIYALFLSFKHWIKIYRSAFNNLCNLLFQSQSRFPKLLLQHFHLYLAAQKVFIQSSWNYSKCNLQLSDFCDFDHSLNILQTDLKWILTIFLTTGYHKTYHKNFYDHPQSLIFKSDYWTSIQSLLSWTETSDF